jgi:hypothetical protein
LNRSLSWIVVCLRPHGPSLAELEELIGTAEQARGITVEDSRARP